MSQCPLEARSCTNDLMRVFPDKVFYFEGGALREEWGQAEISLSDLTLFLKESRMVTEAHAIGGPVESIMSTETSRFEVRVAPVEGDCGLVVVRDVTAASMKHEKDLDVLSDALQTSHDDLRQFVYAASHDLREPLLKITAFGERLRTKGVLNTSYLDVMLSAASRMTNLIDDLLLYSRVGGERGVTPTPMSLSELVLQAQDILSEQVADVGAEIVLSNNLQIVGDPTQLPLLFQNLLSNALKFRRGTPVIRVSAVRVGDRAEVHFVDNGIGFDMRYADRVFQMFERLHSRFEYPGTGIGLALVKRVVERHGGRIFVNSSLGVGTEFVFTLPGGE